jgi:hypothetical protein
MKSLPNGEAMCKITETNPLLTPPTPLFFLAFAGETVEPILTIAES